MVSVTSANSCYVITKFGLKTADCCRRSLRAVPNDLDPDIKVLFLCDNEGAMRHLSADALHHYAGLQEIHFTRDGIESIAIEAFQNTRNLQRLDLDGNALTAVPTMAFKPLSSLRFLSLRGNPLGSLLAGAFHPLASLETLELDYCQLKYVDPRALHHLTQLVQLNIANNELRTLDADIKHHLPPSLTVLRAHHNLWYCDCRLRWLRLWLERAHINWDFAGGDGTPTCSSPAIIANIPWTHLKPDQFACSSRIETGGGSGNSTQGHKELRAGTGGNVTFHCHVYGDPRPSIKWVKGSSLVQTNNGHNTRIVNANATDSRTGEPYERSTLFLYNARVENIGDYRCVAENSAGRSEVMFKLIIEGQKERSDDVIPVPTRSDGKRGIDLAAGAIGWHVLVGVIAGAGLVILILTAVIVIMARRRCAPSVAKQRPFEPQRHEDGTATLKRETGGGGSHVRTANNTSEFSMRAIKAYGSTTHTIDDGAAEKLLVSSKALYTKEQLPSSSNPTSGEIYAKDSSSAAHNCEEEHNNLINNVQLVTSPKFDRQRTSEVSCPLKPSMPIANGSPGKSPVRLIQRSAKNSPQKLPRSPLETNTLTTDARQRNHHPASPAKAVSIESDAVRTRAQTLPRQLPPRIALFDRNHMPQEKDTFRTLRPVVASGQRAERAPCQNPVCLKTHMRVNDGQPAELSQVGNSATLGSRRAAKQANGILIENRSRSVGHLSPTASADAIVDTCTETHTPAPMQQAVNNTPRDVAILNTDISQCENPLNNFSVSTQAVSPHAVRQYTLGIPSTVTPSKTAGSPAESPKRHSATNSYTSATAMPTTIRNVLPQHVNSSLTITSSAHSTAPVVKIATINAHDAAMQQHIHSSVATYPCPGERDEYGTAV